MQRIKARNEEGKTGLSWGRACKQYDDTEGARTHLPRAADIFEALRHATWSGHERHWRTLKHRRIAATKTLKATNEGEYRWLN